jgi:hypothetical protein
MSDELTAERLRDLLDYDPETGVFTNRVSRGSTARAGQMAGSRHNVLGYTYIFLCGRRYLAHRLAWLYMTGSWPSEDIDHANGEPGDDRYANLRVATASQNGMNSRRPRRNTSGFKGVRWRKREQRWCADIRQNGRTVWLGYFETPEEAHNAYCSAARRLFGDFARAE